MAVQIEGDDHWMYGWYNDEIVLSKKKGEVLFDKLKLKSDFAFHSGTNKAVGMVNTNSYSMNFIDEHDVLVDDSSNQIEAFEPTL